MKTRLSFWACATGAVLLTLAACAADRSEEIAALEAQVAQLQGVIDSQRDAIYTIFNLANPENGGAVAASPQAPAGGSAAEALPQTNPQNANPVDDFFYGLLGEVQPTMFVELVVLANAHSRAWRLEMENAFELLTGMADTPWLRRQIGDLRDAYISYSDKWAELETALAYISIIWRGGQSGWFDAEAPDYGGQVEFGPGGSPLYGRAKTRIYREKTLQLHGLLRQAGADAVFVFDRQLAGQALAEALPWWGEAMGM